MVYLSLYDNSDIKIDTDDYDLLRDVKDHFEYFEKDYFWKDAYKMGIWDGKASMFSTAKRTLPHGLFLYLYRFLKKSNDVQITNDIKSLYINDIPLNKINIKYDLKYKPYDYQQICIEDALKKTKGIYRVGTGGGKSLIISYILKILIDNSHIKKGMIIVPTLGLINQFREDLISYGIPKSWIGIVNKDKKEFDKTIVVSTWQTLRNRKNELTEFGAVICDEVHSAKAKEINDIMKHCKMKYKFGVTGTMPDAPLEKLRTISYIGPVWKEYSTKWLADNGYLSYCNVVQVKIKYKKNIKGDYKTQTYESFRNPYRLEIIRHIAENKSNLLILVEKVEEQGVFLKEYLEKKLSKPVVFLSGKDKAEIRDIWRHRMEKDSDVVMIATYGIFSTGINVKAMKNIIISSSSKSKIRILQSIGRSLRLHDNKSDTGAYIWDIQDQTKNLKQHASIRERFYIKEEHNIYDIIMSEKTDKNLNKLFVPPCG